MSTSAQKLSFDASLTSTPRFVSIRLPPLESRITVLPGGNLKISNVLKISPRLRGVPLGLRYLGISSSINLSVVFFSHQGGMAQAGPKSYRRIFASHSSISLLRLQQRQARLTCNDNNNINICFRFFHGEAMVQWDNRALVI